MSLLDCHCKTLFQQGASWGLGCTARISSSIRSVPAKVDIQQLKCISVDPLFSFAIYFFCQFSWARLCTAMQVLFQPRRESMLLLQWVRYFFIMNMKKVNLMTRGPFCMDHLFSWTGGFVCIYCRYKHTSKHTPRRELQGVDLTRRLTQDEWKDVRDGNKLE